MEFQITDKIEENDKAEILAGLIKYDLARIEDKNPKELGIYLRDKQGKILAGIIGETHGKWLMIELRGQCVGSQILEKAESTAKERGCRFVFLDTFSFQASGFYKKHGYQEAFILNEYPSLERKFSSQKHSVEEEGINRVEGKAN